MVARKSVVEERCCGDFRNKQIVEETTFSKPQKKRRNFSVADFRRKKIPDICSCYVPDRRVPTEAEFLILNYFSLFCI